MNELIQSNLDKMKHIQKLPNGRRISVTLIGKYMGSKEDVNLDIYPGKFNYEILEATWLDTGNNLTEKEAYEELVFTNATVSTIKYLIDQTLDYGTLEVA